MGEDAKVWEKREPPRVAWLRAERLGLPFASEDHGWARRWRTGVPRERDSEKLAFWQLTSDKRPHKRYENPKRVSWTPSVPPPAEGCCLTAHCLILHPTQTQNPQRSGCAGSHGLWGPGWTGTTWGHQDTELDM